MRKTVGIMLAQPEDDYQRKFLSGATNRAFQNNIDCAVFSIEYKSAPSPQAFSGAANIFELVNFDLLDAVIILPDTITDKAVLSRLLQRIRTEFSGVTVCVDSPLDDFFCINTDDSAAVEAVCDHFIEQHGFRTLDFMGGIKGHPHAVRRELGYRHALEKHGITVDERRIHDGDFWYTKGDEVADSILNSPLDRPQAVVCANDEMAVSLCKAFRKRGIKVPDDIAVSGYDSIEEARFYNPSIFSAHMPSEQTGINAMNFICSRLFGGEYHPESFQTVLQSGESCGCDGDDSTADFNKLAVKVSSMSKSSDMMSGLIAVNDVEELLGNVAWYAYQIKPFSTFLMCLCDDWEGDCYDENNYRRKGYSHDMHLRLMRYDDKTANIEDIVYSADSLLPENFFNNEKPSVYYFYPLHFLDRCFGYTAVIFEGEPLVPVYDCREWTKCVCNGIECLRRRLNVRNMYDRLRVSAETDSLTGLLNRRAFNCAVETIMNKATHTNVNAMFMMVDLNYLKTINDTFGHLSGDEALKTVARAVESVCGKNENCFRIGGDEFMIIGSDKCSNERVAEIVSGIDRYLGDYNRTSKNPYDVTASMGAVCAVINSKTKIDSLISAADGIMYKDKQRRKGMI